MPTHPLKARCQPSRPRPRRRRPTGTIVCATGLSASAAGHGLQGHLRHTTLIGSATDCPIRLLPRRIAAAHCVITLDNDVIRVRALRPDAGIRVNGHAVDISVLCHGDVLGIGPFSFRVETNLTFELSRTATMAETRMDLVQTGARHGHKPRRRQPATTPSSEARPPAAEPAEPSEPGGAGRKGDRRSSSSSR